MNRVQICPKTCKSKNNCIVPFFSNFEQDERNTFKALKSFQNKKGLKNFQLPTFWCLFLQLAAEKNTEKWAAGKLLGPSYFEETLAIYVCMWHVDTIAENRNFEPRIE